MIHIWLVHSTVYPLDSTGQSILLNHVLQRLGDTDIMQMLELTWFKWKELNDSATEDLDGIL